MSTLISVVGDVEDAVSSGDVSRRTEALRRVTRLFIDQAPQLGDDHVSVFDAVILRLARNLEFRVRVELSRQFADLANAPPGVVRDLAFDDNIAVAEPVLARSPRLSEDDLVEIAAVKGQDHLFALSRRPVLTERVTDLLVDRGDARVVQKVAGNDGARFSPRGFQQLVDRARADESLQATLEARRDLPPDCLKTLIAIVRETVHQKLSTETRAEAALANAVEIAASTLSPEVARRALAGEGRASSGRIADLAAAGEIDEETVAAWLREGRAEDALAAIAALGQLPPEFVTRAYHSANYDPLLFIVRSLRFGWATFKLLLAEKAGSMPPEPVLKAAFSSFQQLSVQTAQRVVRFTVVRERAASGVAA